MTADILTVSNLKKHFVIGQTGQLRERKPITVKAVDGVSFTVRR